MVNGSAPGVDQVMSDLTNTIQGQGISLSFGNLTVNTETYISIDGEEQTNNDDTQVSDLQ